MFYSTHSGFNTVLTLPVFGEQDGSLIIFQRHFADLSKRVRTHHVGKCAFKKCVNLLFNTNVYGTPFADWSLQTTAANINTSKAAWPHIHHLKTHIFHAKVSIKVFIGLGLQSSCGHIEGKFISNP